MVLRNKWCDRLKQSHTLTSGAVRHSCTISRHIIYWSRNCTAIQNSIYGNLSIVGIRNHMTSRPHLLKHISCDTTSSLSRVQQYSKYIILYPGHYITPLQQEYQQGAVLITSLRSSEVQQYFIFIASLSYILDITSSHGNSSKGQCLLGKQPFFGITTSFTASILFQLVHGNSQLHFHQQH